MFQISLTAAQIKAVEKKKAKPAGEKTGDGLAPLDESEEQEVFRFDFSDNYYHGICQVCIKDISNA